MTYNITFGLGFLCINFTNWKPFHIDTWESILVTSPSCIIFYCFSLIYNKFPFILTKKKTTESLWAREKPRGPLIPDHLVWPVHQKSLLLTRSHRFLKAPIEMVGQSLRPLITSKYTNNLGQCPLKETSCRFASCWKDGTWREPIFFFFLSRIKPNSWWVISTGSHKLTRKCGAQCKNSSQLFLSAYRICNLQ